jgi:hypothetical protein
MPQPERREALLDYPVLAGLAAPAAWRLRVDGLGAQPLGLSISEVDALGAQTHTADFVWGIFGIDHYVLYGINTAPEPTPLSDALPPRPTHGDQKKKKEMYPRRCSSSAMSDTSFSGSKQRPRHMSLTGTGGRNSHVQIETGLAHYDHV